MKTFYQDLEIEVDDGMYYPREDTFLILENLEVEEGERVLEIGTGCGLISILCSKKGADVTATDINEKAIEVAKRNAEKHGLNIKFKKSDLFTRVEGKYDLIIFNPPYLPGKRRFKEDIALVNSGTIEKFLKNYKNHLKKDGRCLLVLSSLSDVEREGKIIAEKKLSFEKLFLLELKN